MDHADVVPLFNTIGDPIVTPTSTPTSPPSPTPTATTVPTTTVQTPAPPPLFTLAATGLDLQNEWVLVRNTGAAPVLTMGCTVSDQSIPARTIYLVHPRGGATMFVHSGIGTITAADFPGGPGSTVWNDPDDTAMLKWPAGTGSPWLTRP